MGDREFYMTIMTLQTVARTFSPTPVDVPAEMRAQRALNERRVPDIVDYLLDHDADWVFGSVTVSFDGTADFKADPESKSGMGTLWLDADTEFVVVDGQHRIAAIRRALEEDRLLRSQQIGVMLIPFESLDRNQQVFSDLNRTVQKTSRSLDILYDHNDPLNGIIMSVAQRVPLFRDRVEKNSTSLALRSPKFITLSALYDACRQALGGKAGRHELAEDEHAEAAEEFLVNFWNALTEIIAPWRHVRDGELRPSEARAEYIVAHAVAFYALGTSGARLLDVTDPRLLPPKAALEVLQPLGTIDWSKSNPAWQGIAMLGTSVVTRHQTRVALSRRICHLAAPDRFEDAASVIGL